MKPRYPTPLLLLVFGLATAITLFVPNTSRAQTPTHHHKKATPGPQDDDGDATPSATPTPTPSPSAASPDGKPAATSADEAAPSKESRDAKAASNGKNAAAVSTIEPAEIDGFDSQPEPIRKLLAAALELTKKNLTYAYGSTDPASGGMDCSGTIFYLLSF